MNMTKLIKMSAVAMLTMIVMPVLAQEYTADMILGKWLNEDKDAHIEIYKDAGKYFGKIVWLKEPNELDGKPKVDDENDDPTLQTRPIMGLLILKDFIFDGEDEWEDGTIYDPKNGTTYDCYINFDDDGSLKIRGYVGISWIGRNTYWTRVK
jgi:uncharacterized protein (DUF2147 family)